jgi:hypothetical protein
MRFVALLVVVAIIYVAWSRRSPVASTAEAMKEADAVAGPTPAMKTYYPPTAAPAPATSSGLRAPIDRTRAVLDQAKQRNSKGEF